MNAAIAIKVSKLLTTMLANTCHPWTPRITGEDFGFDSSDSDNFEQNSMMISRELVAANTSLLSYVVSDVFDSHSSKILIEELLSDSRILLDTKMLFYTRESFQAHYDELIANYERQMKLYTDILRRGERGAEMSTAFIRYLELDTEVDNETQEKIAYRFDLSINKSHDLLGRYRTLII
jgi:hypothetical protein